MFGQFVKFLVSKCLFLLEEFRDTHLRSYRVDALTFKVNLDAALRLPFPHAKVERKPRGSGWVEVKRIGERLFADGMELASRVPDRQRDDIQVHPNVLDALAEDYPNLIPQSLKTDEQGRTRYTFCRGTTFRGEYHVYVRYFYWDKNKNVLERRPLRLEEEREDYLLSAWGEKNPSFQLVNPC